MLLGYHTEYLTRHPFHCGQSEIWIIGTNGSRGCTFLRWFQALRMFVDNAHRFLPGLRCKGKGVARCLLPCVGFLSFAGTWASLSVGYQIIPGGAIFSSALTSRMTRRSPLRSLDLPLCYFPEALGATAPRLLGLCGCWSALGHSIGPGGTGSP